MKVRLAHLNIQGVNVAIFDAKPVINTNSKKTALLVDLTSRARTSGLSIQKSALAYAEGQHIVYFGTPDLVLYLQDEGIPQWTYGINT